MRTDGLQCQLPALPITSTLACTVPRYIAIVSRCTTRVIFKMSILQAIELRRVSQNILKCFVWR